MFSSNTTQVSNGGYQISRSLRFNSADSAYLNRTPASATNRKTWTYSVWLKRGQLTASDDWRLLACRPSSGVYTLFSFINTGSGSYPNALQLVDNNGTSLATTPVYRDPSAWYHIVLAVDTTQATASNRVRIYANGTEVTAFSASTYPSQNLDMQINTANAHNIGRDPSTGTSYFDGYHTEINFVDGSQLTPSSFGETNAQTGVWTPIAYAGSYGTNGFYLNFSDNSNTTAATLGKDYSGNGNNWTPNNFSVTSGSGNDSLVDSPTSYGTDTGVGGEVRGNYATLNAVGNTSGRATLSNGNLDVVPDTSGSYYPMVPATIGVTSGKWYWEYTLGATNNTGRLFGIVTSSATVNNYIGFDAYGWGYFGATGQKYTNNIGSSYGASFTNGDVVGVAFDADAGTLVFYKNGTSQGTAFSGLTSGPYFPAYSLGSSGNNGTTSLNFGQRPFAYTAPSGYKALCTQNLPTPTIGATTATTADKYFGVNTYTGTGATQVITNSGFQPDWVWLKIRSASSNHVLIDSVRGYDKYLASSSTAAESTSTDQFLSFNSNGFTLGSNAGAGGNTNQSGSTYVGWQWRASNATAVTNTAGSITSTVSANTTSGFSIATFTSQASGTATVGHGLGVAPSMVIVKGRNVAYEWYTYHVSLGASAYVSLSNTAASASSTTLWNATSPTSSVFSLGTAWTGSNTFVAYCFAEVAGYSKFGSYTGNGSADGPFVFTGMRPAYVLIKSSTFAGSSWRVWDAKRSTYNVVNSALFPNLSNAEVSTADYAIDFLSNGFKIRSADAGENNNADTYIFAAFAENPFKYSLAR